MKIGILTHHYIDNFGAFLQAYSLQEALKEQFPNDEIYIIDYLNFKHFLINVGGWFRFYKEKETLSSWFQKIKVPSTFSKERKKYMQLTKTCFNAKDVENLGLDYVIVGSDEVWNYKDKKGNAKIKFGEGLNKKQLVAYAPSVGQTEDKNVPDYVSEGILKFKAVSARDDLTQKLAADIRKETIQRVVDPTFLYRVPDESVESVKKPYILFYYCDGFPKEEKKKIFEYAKKKGLSVYGAGECDKNYTSTTVNLSPFQWVWMFRNAEAVITGTFHGAVFSMLNHRQFACYLTNPSRIKKVGSLLQEYGLGDRQCKADANKIISTIENKIDYEIVEEKIDARRVESKKFLNSVITEK